MIRNFLEQQGIKITDTLKAIRKGGEPFFGIQTIFAPYVDELIAEHEQPAKPGKTAEGTTTPRSIF